MAETKIINVGNGNKQKQLQVTDVTKNIEDISHNTILALTPQLDAQQTKIIQAVNAGTETAIRNQLGENGLGEVIRTMNTTIDTKLKDFLKEFKKTQPVGENKCPECPKCENEKKSTTTNSFDIVFNASEKTFEDAKNAIENKKKLIVNESSLDDNIKEIYPNIESKDDEKRYTLENTLDNLKILIEVKRIKILKQIYPKIQEYLKNWRDTYEEKENCDKEKKKCDTELADVIDTAIQWKDNSESKDKKLEDVIDTANQWKADSESKDKKIKECKKAEKNTAEQMPPYVETEEEKAAKALAAKKPLNGGNKKSKEYLKYKNQYLKLKEELNQLHK